MFFTILVCVCTKNEGSSTGHGAGGNSRARGSDSVRAFALCSWLVSVSC